MPVLSFRQICRPLGLTALLAFSSATTAFAHDPLPSWRDTASKARITAFIDDVTNTASNNYVEPKARIATFDNDGTLWSEQPVYFQLLFSLDQIKAMAADHPEWKTTQPFQAVLENDLEALKASGQKGLMEILAVTHSGMTEAKFRATVQNWAAMATHPKTGRPYTEMIFQPMLEVLDYFRANGFKTYIVSGGGVQFMRAMGLSAYGIPPEQYIGSSIVSDFEIRDGVPVIVRKPDVFFNNDKAGKPVAIQRVIGRRPIAAFGNSDGDLQMLQWTDAGHGNTLKVIVHHTDEAREWAYDRGSHIGGLDKALDIAGSLGWTLVDMKEDWSVIYPFETK